MSKRLPLPYRWHARGTRMANRPEVGMLWPWEHRVYRIVEVKPIELVDWTEGDHKAMDGLREPWRTQRMPCHFVCRPIEVTEYTRGRNRDVHFRFGGERGPSWLEVYPDEHYAICAECREPLPCRDQMARRISEQAAKEWARYETAGICPACSEPVTSRQQAKTWRDNMKIPGGPPVTFHLRGKCYSGARAYDEEWAAADPEHREFTLQYRWERPHNDWTFPGVTGA